MGKIGVGVVGVGAWGRNHVRVFKELKDANLVVICDLNAETVKLTAEKYNVKWTTDYMDVLEDKMVEAVSICTPAETHAEIALNAIKAGKHVLVEKPMTGDVEKAEAIVREAEKEGVLVYVGFIERFNPGVMRIKELIEGGEIGDVALISSRRLSRWPIRITDVGVVKDTAIHDFDLFRYILSEDPLEVYAVAGKVRHRFEDYVEVMFKFRGDKVGFVEANWLTPKKVRKLTVTGMEGILHLDFISQEVVIEKTEATAIPSFTWEEPLKIELDSFLKAILEKTNPLVTGEDGIRALKIAEAVLKSARDGKPVAFK